jgi:hypothetical protein
MENGIILDFRLKISYWLLAISCWQLFLSGFAPRTAWGLGRKLATGYWLLATIFIRFCAKNGMGVRVKKDRGSPDLF